jgi:hypothetical protein
MDRFVSEGFDFSPLNIIPKVLLSHFPSSELYQQLANSLKIHLKTESTKYKINNNDSKESF